MPTHQPGGFMDLVQELRQLLAKATGSDPYGDVEYADPGLQADRVKRYPIDTPEHVRAAWSYIHHGADGAKYSPAQRAAIEDRIAAAWRSKIDPKGPPSLKKGEVPGILLKSADEDRMVYGWASVSKTKQGAVVDSHKHEITTKAIRKLMHGVIAGQRAGKLLHQGAKKTDIVESLVFTPELWKGIGDYLAAAGEITAEQAQVFHQIQLEGALTGFHVGDDDLWAAVKANDFELSIGVEEATLENL